MNPIGWFFKILTAGDAPGAEFKKIDFNFKAKHMRVRTATSLEVSFDGKDTHLKVLAADNLQSFQDVNKGEVWYKGTGDAEITAWDGN